MVELPWTVAFDLTSVAQTAIPKIITRNHKIRNLFKFLEKTITELSDQSDILKNSAPQIEDGDVQSNELQLLQQEYIGC